MASNRIQVKRTSTSGRTPNTTNTANGQYILHGELALNLADGILYSSNGALIPIGANNADVNVTANLSINKIVANNALGSAGQTLTSNSVGGVYWSTITGGGGSVNADAQYTWTNTQTFQNTITFSSTINGTVNNATYLTGNSVSDLNTYASDKAANAYSNAVSTAASDASTKAGTAYSNATSYADTKAGTAYTNAVSYIDTKIGTANTAITGNAATAYTNAVSYTDGKILTANGAITGNAATAYTNAVSYTDTKIGTANTAITGNAATAYTNAVSYTDAKILTANGAITGNAATAYSNATTFASNADNISSGTLNTAILPATANISTAVNVGANINLTTSSINVGSLSIKANSIVIPANASIDFNTTTYKPDFQKGRMYWDNEEQTIVVFGDGSSFEQSMGQREWVRTRNSTASTIPKGTPVYITGVHISGDPVHGHHPTIAPGDASDYDKSQIIGITGEAIAPSSHGYTVVRGYIEGLDTSALTSGQRAHLGFLTPGTIVLNAPEYPNYPTDLGMCLSSNSTVGTFYVDLAMHTAERFRTTADMYVGGKLTVAGDLNVTGNVFVTSATNLSVSDNIIYLGGGDTIAPSAITHTGGGLDDMLFHGVFEGTSSTTYYVKITSASGSIDKFTWSKDNFATTSGTANVTITAGTYFPLDNGLSIAFNADNGHHLNDIWYATAAPINVDIGLVGNYNDTSYKHTGLFRDASDGVYKFFQGYTPEPDAAVNIDTGHASFQFAAVQANTFTGNLLGTANNANNLGGTAASSYQLNSTLAANVAILTANNANNLGGTAASSYQLNSTLAANVAILTANNANNFGGQSYSTVTGYITGNAATAYTNAVSYVDTKIGTANTAITGNTATAYTNAVSYVDTKIGTANSAITSNAATAYTNAVSYVDTKIGTANTAITGNAATAYTNAVSYVDTKIGTANSAITSNAATAYTNAVSYTDSKILTANGAITGNAAAAYSNAIAYSGNAAQAYSNAVSAIAVSTSNNSNYLGGTAAANFVQNTDSRTLSGNLNFTGSNNYFSSQLYVGSNAYINTSSLFIGNSTVYANVGVLGINLPSPSAVINVGNSTVNSYMTPYTIAVQGGSSSQLIVGNSTVNTTILSAALQINYRGTNVVGTRGIELYNTADGTSYTYLNFNKGRISGSGNSNSGDTLGSISFYGSDDQGAGGGTISGAQIKAQQESAFVATQSTVATRLLFYTSDNVSTTAERLRITGNGNIGIGNNAPTDKLSIGGTSYHGGNVVLGSSSLAVGLQANGGYGTAGQVLTSNGTATYWAGAAADTVNNANHVVYANYRTVTASPNTVLANDSLILVNITANSTINLPAASTTNGSIINIKNINTGYVSIIPNGSDTIDGQANLVIQYRYSAAGLISTSTGWAIV